MSNTGYLYRIAPYTAEQALAFAASLMDDNAWWFSASQQWDVKIKQSNTEAESLNLRPFQAFNPANADLVFKGDFGRIFCAAWELRWKRLDDGQYDLLILTEQQTLALPAEARCLAPKYHVRTVSQQSLVVHQAEGQAQQQVSYVEYLAENQAVMFVRYRALT